MNADATEWAEGKLRENKELELLGRTNEGFIIMKADDQGPIHVAVLGMNDVIREEHVRPLFAGGTKPDLVINVPSSTSWSGSAIQYVHDHLAAFGKLGDVSRAIKSGSVSSYRDDKMGFFIKAMEQHLNVRNVTYIFDNVFTAERVNGADLTVAVIDAYNMSAEDVRHAKTRFGDFDILVKNTSYGSITSEAMAAAKSMGVETLKFGQLMGRLNK